MRRALFSNRAEAGRQLAEALQDLGGGPFVVLGLPRGGVPVAYPVAVALGAPLDIIVVRKLGVPFQPELGMGAIGEDGARVLNADVISDARLTEKEVAEVEGQERTELERRVKRFRGDREHLPLTGRTAIIVDDGIATGSTARAACQVARLQGARQVVLAVPVASPQALRELRPEVDQLVCLAAPAEFVAIGQFYGDFAETPDAEVTRLLELARAGSPPKAADPPSDEEVEIRIGPVALKGRLTIPDGAVGVVVFAHGSGSTRFSPRNRSVAAALNRDGMGTLLFDLLSEEEEVDRSLVFDIDLLAARLSAVTAWLRHRPAAERLPVGYFGASTGAAAALVAAADPAAEVAAVVSRGGRPDLAASHLPVVRAPTLLIVGSLDKEVLWLNRAAQSHLTCLNRLVTVSGATHLFSEPGALEQVAGLASRWFHQHLTEAPPKPSR